MARGWDGDVIENKLVEIWGGLSPAYDALLRYVNINDLLAYWQAKARQTLLHRE